MRGRARMGWVAAALLLLVPAPALGAETAVDAGALRAVVERNPWRIDFQDRAGRSVLTEHAGRGVGDTGALGFRTGAGWQRATRVISAQREGAAFVAELATTDPADRRNALRRTPDGDGVIALEASVLGGGATALGMGFQARRGERYLGFGERSNAVDQRGNELESYVAEGPYQFEVRPFLSE